MLDAAEIRRQPKSKFEVNALVMIDQAPHVCRIEARVPDDALPHGDVHKVIQHRMIGGEERSVPQSRHVQAGSLQWQLKVSRSSSDRVRVQMLDPGAAASELGSRVRAQFP